VAGDIKDPAEDLRRKAHNTNCFSARVTLA
jgi:hypothetical protein